MLLKSSMESDRVVRLHINLEINELFRENLAALLIRLKLPAIIYVVVLGLSVNALILLVFLPSENSRNLIDQLLPAVGVMGAIAILVPLSLWISARKATKDARAKAGYEVTIADSGYSSVGSTGRVELAWNAFLRARETKRSFQFYVTKGAFYFAPKRCFASESDVQLAREIIRTHIEKAKLLS